MANRKVKIGWLLAGLFVAGSPAAAHRHVFPSDGSEALQSRGSVHAVPVTSKSGTWTKLVNAFPDRHIDTPQLLTDGTVLVHQDCSRKWLRLTPDNTGSYVNGTWSSIAPMTYAPLYFASQVLADGRLIVFGGEYSRDENGDCVGNLSNKGSLYDPVGDTWTALDPPPGWNYIGDAASTVLPDGRFMLQEPFPGGGVSNLISALGTVRGDNITWTMTGNGKADENNEEGWTLLPNGTVLTIDTNRDLGKSFSDTETYDPATGNWTAGKKTPVSLVDPEDHEIGPAILMPNGKVFVAGAGAKGPLSGGHTAILDTTTGKWKAGPDFPTINGYHLQVEDGPAAILPDGNVLIPASDYNDNAKAFFEFDGKQLIQVRHPDMLRDASVLRLLVLPTGQILYIAPELIEVYTSSGEPDPAWRPTITSAPSAVARGSLDNPIKGTLFNGLSEGASYGDDAQMATNYPLVRITNNTSNHVCYARTHDHSAMGISIPGVATSTTFDVPRRCEAGASKLEVIANGIASVPVDIMVN